jgi:hypothetical protein
LKFTERELRSVQATGRHLFPAWRGLLVEWAASNGRNTQDEPDTRFFNNSSRVIGGQTFYEWETSGLVNPARYYRKLEETRKDYGFDLTLPFQAWGGREAKLKAGGALPALKGRSASDNISIAHLAAGSMVRPRRFSFRPTSAWSTRRPVGF